MQVIVDLTQEEQQYRHDELEIKSFDDVIDMRLKGAKPYQVGAMTLVARELGDIEQDILPTNKVTLVIGAAVTLSRREAALKRNAIMPNGKTMQVRQYIAPTERSHSAGDTHSQHAAQIGAELEMGSHMLDDTRNWSAAPNGGDGIQSPSDAHDFCDAIIPTDQEGAADRAEYYLMHNVMGRITENFKIIAPLRGEVRTAADLLIAEINALVDRIENSNE